MNRYRHKEYLMVKWLLCVKYDWLTVWERNFLKSLSNYNIGRKISHKQEYSLAMLYSKNRNPKRYYAAILM